MRKKNKTGCQITIVQGSQFAEPKEKLTFNVGKSVIEPTLVLLLKINNDLLILQVKH